MALSSMLLGHWTRPPYWKVLLRFCSQALAMPERIKRSSWSTLRSPSGTAGRVWRLRFTLVLICGAGTDVLEELEQERLQNVRAAVERRQDVQQPPSPLTAVPARKHTHAQIRAGLAVITPGVENIGVLRFGAGVGCYLLHQLAVGFILNQSMFTT